MTYCCGILVREGLVMIADTRTNAGLDNVSTFRKLHVYTEPGDRIMALASSGNLSLSQSVRSTLTEGMENPETGERETLMNSPTMFQAAQRIGRTIRHVQSQEGQALEAAEVDHDVAFLFGGQIKGERLRLFMIYSAGNFIECTTDTPYLQIGEHKYGKPVLDRAIGFDTDLYDALKIGLISMDSTMRSNLGVGLPIDLLVARRDTCAPEVNYRIEPGEPYFQDLRERWSTGFAPLISPFPAPLTAAPADFAAAINTSLRAPRELPLIAPSGQPPGLNESQWQAFSPSVNAEKRNGCDVLRGKTLLVSGRPRSQVERNITSWDRARLSVVVPIGVIVAVAIVCIVVAVLSSAERADEVAIEHEKSLFSRALINSGGRVLREVETVVGSEDAFAHISSTFDQRWAEQHVARPLQRNFDQDYVLIFDGDDKPLLSVSRDGLAASSWINDARGDLPGLLAFMRGRTPDLPDAVRLDEQSPLAVGAHSHAVVMRQFLHRPAIIAAATIDPPSGVSTELNRPGPIILSVRFIGGNVLADVASRLRLTHLREVSAGDNPPGDYVYTLTDPHGLAIAHFAWTPQQPGAEIVSSVVPFVTVALAGFALLAAFVLRYMRRTATAIVAGEARLRHLAMHDPLCGLPNRIFFGERLEALIEEVRAGSTPAAVFYIDLDHFKDVNDTLGHHVGDELIRNVTLRLSHTLRAGDLVARLGGDEFAVISSIGNDHDKMLAMAQRIIAALCAPYAINKQNIVIGASIGIAVIDDKSGAAADIMRYADIALYRAKNEGRNRACIYDAAMDAELSNRKLLEGDLREAIENDALQVYYQPIVNNSGEVVVGVEALCRWTHPKRGVIPPSEFIPAAEHSGLIVELGAYVLRRACIDGNAWPKLSVAVNVSPLQLRRTDFAPAVERILAETQFDPARLELELTESVLLGNIESAEAGMLRLKALGVRLALDDFGTGYSSLLYLRRFPFDKLKIDRSFVLAIEKAADAAAIVHAVVSLGRGLGMKVTAEGVETADQQLFLRAAGVHCMQGYRFGKAVPAAEITERLAFPGAFRANDEPTALAAG